MKCKVTVKGKNSARFNALTEKFGQITALKSIYDSDGSASIDGYQSDVEISNRVNAAALSTFNHMVAQSGKKSLFDMTADDLTKSRRSTALDAVYSDIEQIAARSMKDFMEGKDKVANQEKARKALVFMETFEELEPKIKEKLNGFGLEIKNIDNDLESIYNTETKEESKERIYSQDYTETSRVDTMTPQVKLYMATLPQYRTEIKNGRSDVVEVYDDLGMKVPNDFNETYSFVSKHLSDLHSFDDMLTALENLSNVNPMAQAIYEDLFWKSNEPTEKVVYNGKTINNFENAFFSAFKNAYHQFTTVTVKEKSVPDGEGGTMKTNSVSVLNTNRRRLHNVIKNAWLQNNRMPYAMKLSAKKDFWSSPFEDSPSMSEFFGTKNTRSMVSKLDNSGDISVLHDLANYLQSSGIDVSVKALRKLRTDMNKNESKSFSKYVLTNNVSLRSVLNSFWNEGADAWNNEASTLNSLAKAEADISHDRSGGAFMNGSDNMVHPINLPTSATELISELGAKTGRYDDFLVDPLLAPFHTLEQFTLKGKKNRQTMALFDTIYNNDRGEGIDYGSLDPTSALASRLELFMGYDAKGKMDKSHGWFMAPTPADRSGSRIFYTKRLKDTQVSSNGLINKDGDMANWLTQTAGAELQRIKKVREEYYGAQATGDTSKMLDNYHTSKNGLGQGGYFNYYPELNSLLPEGDLVGFELDVTSPEVQTILEDSYMNQVQADVDYMRSVGIIQEGSGYTDLKMTEFAEKILPKGLITDRNIHSFVANSVVVNHELSAMFNGDLAHFKGGVYNADGTYDQTKQLAEANKRAGLADTPGTKLRVGPNGAKSHFKVAFVEDLTFDSDYTQQYIDAIGAHHGIKYYGLEVTDGQGMVSLDRYADILAGQGMLTQSFADTITELKKVDPDMSKVTEVLQPIKGFLFGQRFDPEYDRIMPQNLKYSLLPVIPSALKGNPMMQNLHKRMEGSGTDEMVFKSGAKFGAYNVNQAEGEGAFTTMTMSNEDWRMPQIVPYKTKTYENMGTQTRKLITGNLNPTAMYGNKTGEQLMAAYQSALIGNMRESLTGLIRELFDGKTVSVAKVAKKVINDLSKNAYKSTPDFMERALEVITDEAGKVKTRIPMSFPAIKQRVESSLNSMVRKAVTKQDLPGFSAVQYAAVGFGKDSIKTDETLAFVRKEDGKVLPAEVKMSPQYFIQSLLKKKQTPEIKALIERLQKGTVDMKGIDPKLLEAVIYRIPTQGKNSMLPVKVVGFTPEALGSTIVIPAELTTQSGADYDIDKVYVEMRHFVEEKGSLMKYDSSLDTKQGRDNTIVDTHYDILTSPEHFAELVTPNHSDTLNKLSGQMSGIFGGSTAGRKWSSLATQDDFREKNQAGGVYIGISSIANTAHPLLNELGAKLEGRFDGPVIINGVAVDSLGEMYTFNSRGKRTNRLISEDHMEIQTASVDNAKNPVLGNLNINTVTGAVHGFLVEAGAGLEYATKLVSSPVVRELTRLTRMNEATMGRDAAFSAALKELTDDATIINHLEVSENDFDVSLQTLNDALENQDGTHDGEILKAFLTFRSYGQDLKAVLGALQMDNIGAKQSLAGNFIQQHNLSKVKGTYSNAKFSEKGIEGEISTVTLDRSKYQKHSMEAFEQYGLQSAINIVGQVIDDTQPVQTALLDQFRENVGDRVSEKDVRLLMNDFYSYAYLNRNAYEGDTSAIGEMLDSDSMAEALVGPDSVGKSVLRAQREELSKMNEDVTYRPNAFVMALTVDLNDASTGYDLVNFNNTVSRALSAEEKSTLSNEFLALVENDPELAQGLLLYNFGMDGFNRGSNSFGEYIHAEVYELVESEGSDRNLVEFYENMREDFDSVDSFDTTDFMSRFLRNRLNEISSMPDYSRIKRPKQIKDALVANPKVNMFKVTHNGELALAKRTGEGSYVIVGEALGHKGKQVEYQSGDALSEHQDVRDALKEAQLRKDVKDNGKC